MTDNATATLQTAIDELTNMLLRLAQTLNVVASDAAELRARVLRLEGGLRASGGEKS